MYPISHFWSHLRKQEFTGKTEELIPVSEVIRVTQDTLALIGNASNYISQTRCTAVISSIAKSQPKLTSFLKEICKEDLGDTGVELFGPEVQKKTTQRASTIEAFNKAISRVDNPSPVPSSSSSFLSKHPAAKYGGELGRSYTPYNKFRQHRQGYRGNKGPLPTPKEVPKLQTQRLGNKDQPARGILQSHLHAWRQITNNPWVLQCIQILDKRFKIFSKRTQ